MAKPMIPSTATQQLASLADEAFISGHKNQCIKAIELLYELHTLPPSRSPAGSAKLLNRAVKLFAGAYTVLLIK